MQQRWAPPFLKVELDALLAVGYDDIGWREVTTEAFGLPNPKSHVILVATAGPSSLVDSCLFSTVRCWHAWPTTLLPSDVWCMQPVVVHAGPEALFWLSGRMLSVWRQRPPGRWERSDGMGHGGDLRSGGPLTTPISNDQQPRPHHHYAP
jgi:hypothetical protein